MRESGETGKIESGLNPARFARRIKVRASFELLQRLSADWKMLGGELRRRRTLSPLYFRLPFPWGVAAILYGFKAESDYERMISAGIGATATVLVVNEFRKRVFNKKYQERARMLAGRFAHRAERQRIKQRKEDESLFGKDDDEDETFW